MVRDRDGRERETETERENVGLSVTNWVCKMFSIQKTFQHYFFCNIIVRAKAKHNI